MGKCYKGVEEENTSLKCTLCVEPTSPMIFEQNKANLKKQVAHLMKAHEGKLSAIIKDATGLEMDEIVPIDIKTLNFRQKSRRCSGKTKEVVSIIRRILKGRIDAKKLSRQKRKRSNGDGGK